MTKLQRKRIEPKNVFESAGYPYSQAISTSSGKLLFLSGQVALDVDSNYVGLGDIAAQTRQVYANLALVLEAVGAHFSNVVDLTTFIVGREHLPGHLEALKEIYKKLYPRGDYPADTVVLVDGLYRKEFLLEVKATAILPD
jgi:enamine deaminase RidA (YjgF/YER057c/UK114 family)